MRTPIPTAEEAKGFRFSEQSIRNALRDLGIDFAEGPKEFVMRCFFHDDREGGKPNLYVHIREDDGKPVGMYHCFRCNAKGDFPSFVRVYTGWAEIKIAIFCKKHRATDFGPGPQPKRKAVATVTEERLQQYMYRHAYCYDRGLTEDTLRRYRVGYDKEENAIIIPWFDRVGKLAALKRRSVMEKYYIFESDESPWKLLFGLHLVRPKRIVWVCEGEFDAMYLDQCFRVSHLQEHAAIALGGKNLLRPAVVELLKKVPRAIVLALDSDDAGREAREKIEREYRGEFYFVPVNFVEGKDPNELPLTAVVKYAKEVESKVTTHENSAEQRYEAWKEEKNKCVD